MALGLDSTRESPHVSKLFTLQDVGNVQIRSENTDVGKSKYEIHTLVLKRVLKIVKILKNKNFGYIGLYDKFDPMYWHFK